MIRYVIADWFATAMPAAVYAGGTAGPGADTIALITAGYAPGALTGQETISLFGDSVVNGPRDIIQPTNLALLALPGRLMRSNASRGRRGG